MGNRLLKTNVRCNKQIKIENKKKGEGDSYRQLKEYIVILILLSISVIACVPLSLPSYSLTTDLPQREMKTLSGRLRDYHI